MTASGLHRVLPSSRDRALFDLAASRRIETAALAAASPGALMRAAGHAVARLALAVAPHAERIWVAAGLGHNGGDGLEAAAHLAAAGRRVDVGLQDAAERLPADARAALERAQAAGASVAAGLASPALGPADLALDALLGLGARRPPVGAMAAAVRHLNAQRCAVLAVDVPSGLDVDTGQPLGDDCVIATHTLSILCLRPGLFTASGRDHVGDVWLADLGVTTGIEVPTAVLSASTPSASARRRHAQNKGSFGDVVVVGGATGMTGAALLAGGAAQAAGAGRVFVHLLQPAGSAFAVDVLRPELMFRNDTLLADAAHLARATTVCGCGGGDAVADVLPRLLADAGRLVLDADALNALARDSSLAARLVDRSAAGGPTVLTPHPLEAARLLGGTVAEVQADRLGAARRLVDRFGCAVVLKGSGSIVAAPTRTPRVNASGNATLASAGTGDVLAGWLGGSWAQASEAGDGFDAAVRAVAQHGAAAGPADGVAVRAGDLIEALCRRG